MINNIYSIIYWFLVVFSLCYVKGCSKSDLLRDISILDGVIYDHTLCVIKLI